MTNAEGYQKAILMLVIDEEGTVIAVQENGKELEYEEEPKEGPMDAGIFSIQSGSPCRWRKIRGKWRCI